MAIRDSTIAGVRFGMGLRPGRAPDPDPGALLAEVEAAARARPLIEPVEMTARHALQLQAREYRSCAKKNSSDQDCRAAFRAVMNDQKDRVSGDHVRWLGRMLSAETGVGDRLALFWSSHFAVDFKSVAVRMSALDYEDRVIRRHMTGRFADMLKAVARHPAMLLYLSQYRSIGPNSRVGLARGRGLNEDFARELLELHTVGLGAYGQADVREFALTLAGLGVLPDGSFEWRDKWAEPGVRHVMGRSYAAGGLAAIDAVLEDLAAHPKTAERIAVKLARHFSADTPDPGLVAALTRAYRAHDGRLAPVYRTLFEHPAPWRGFGEKVKAPIDYVVSGLRALGAGEAMLTNRSQFRLRLLIPMLTEMGQLPFRPKSPEGWPDLAEDWISPAQLTARHRFADRLARAGARRGVDTVARAALADALRPATRRHMDAVKRQSEKLMLVFASPEFNRR